MQVGLHQPPRAAGEAAEPGGGKHDQTGAPAQQQQRRHGATDEPIGEILVIGRHQGQGHQQAAAEGNSRARLALEVFTTDIRRYLGSLLVELGGADVIVFTGGIGENQPQVRATVCQGLEELGVQLDENANAAADGESCISDEGSRSQVWVIPTNEELIVARQVCQLLEG